jgi:lysophospholipase L1-like esterase
MKSILTSFLFTLVFAAPVLHADTIIVRTGPAVLQPNDMVAICGDSITEQRIYSVYMEDYLLMCQPAKDLKSAQFGWAGERADGFDTRIQSCVLPFKPTVATTCYGMNDGTYKPMTPEIGDAYRMHLTSVVDQLKAGGIRSIIVGTPGAIDPAKFNRTNPPDVYNETLGALSDIAKDIAAKEGVGFADVHGAMMDAIQKAKAAYGADYIIAPDGIHPLPNGHIVMAYAFLKGLGCDGAIGTITVDMAAGKADGTDGQKIISCQGGNIAVESTRYPFCFEGDPAKPGPKTVSMLKFVPFNEELNRYMLVVKGLTGTKAKVTWGKETKEFAVADLAKGINLAAEFLDNPFVDQFKKVDAAVAAQQAYETPLVKVYFHEVPKFEAMVSPNGSGNSKAAFDQTVQAGVDYDAGLFQAAKALVIPVQHTITVVAEP